MSPLELVLMTTATLGSGALLAGASYLRDIRDDASTALRILTGEEELEDDGLIHQVEALGEAIEGNSRAIAENNQRINQLQDDTHDT